MSVGCGWKSGCGRRSGCGWRSGCGRRSGCESFPSEVSLASKCLHSGIILFIDYIYSGRSHQLAPLIHGKEWSY